ncbi:MAG: hypothetical protein EA374_03905 [Acholeplasmatales bacterium]|nr:MAG: hypothetical protein EA374_03905 [Acholeplasmatales bacterium]
MKTIERFVNRMFKQTKMKQADGEAAQKMIEMLKEKVEDLKENGMDEDEAIQKTIVEFGEIDAFFMPAVRRETRRYKRHKTVHHYRNDLLFSALASLLIIGIFALINIFYLPFVDYGPWFVIPAAGVLFWPLSLLYKWLNKKGESD